MRQKNVTKDSPIIGHFTVKDGSEGEGDLVLIQTFFALLWKLFLKNTSKHKNNLIYIIKQEGLYQNKVTLSLASIHNCKTAYCHKSTLRLGFQHCFYIQLSKMKTSRQAFF